MSTNTETAESATDAGTDEYRNETTAPSRINALPPTPLTDDTLRRLAKSATGVNVWVPEGRSYQVVTHGGRHVGGVLDFFLETPSAYIKCGYTSQEDSGSELAWHRFKPTLKDEWEVEMVEELLDNHYKRLEVSN